MKEFLEELRAEWIGTSHSIKYRASKVRRAIISRIAERATALSNELCRRFVERFVERPTRPENKESE
jgi:hypothetical protein